MEIFKGGQFAWFTGGIQRTNPLKPSRWERVSWKRWHFAAVQTEHPFAAGAPRLPSPAKANFSVLFSANGFYLWA